MRINSTFAQKISERSLLKQDDGLGAFLEQFSAGASLDSILRDCIQQGSAAEGVFLP